MRKIILEVLPIVIGIFTAVGVFSYSVFTPRELFTTNIISITEIIGQMETNLTSLRSETKNSLDANQSDILSRMDESDSRLSSRLDTLSTKVGDIGSKIQDNGVGIDNIDKKLKDLETQVTTLEQSTKDLQEKVTGLEDTVSRLRPTASGGGGGGGGGGGSPNIPIATKVPDGIMQIMKTSDTVDFYSFVTQIDNDTLILVYSVGMESNPPKSHYIARREYSVSTGIWSSPSAVYEEGVSSCPAGGTIGANIFVFFHRPNEVGYIESSNLTGTSWSDFVPLVTYGANDTSISPFSNLVYISENTYLQPYTHISGNIWKVKLFRTTDAGVTWSSVTVYEGTTKYCEPTLTYIGDNKLIILMRENDGAPFGQSISNDGGNTWSVPSTTNIGTTSGGIKTGTIIYDSESNKLITVFADRGDNSIKVVSSNATNYSSPISWSGPKFIDNVGVQVRGYGSLIKVDANRFFFTYTRVVNPTNEDIYYGYLSGY